MNSSSLPSISGLIFCALLQWQTMCVAADVCGTKFTDPVSSTRLAQVVLQGKVLAVNPELSDARTRSANVSVMQVYKGMHILENMDRGHQEMVKVTRFGEEDKDNCIASMEVMHSEKPHVFFLYQTSHRDMLQLSALPLELDQGLDRSIRRSLCDTCVRPPHIRRIRCVNCSVPPKIRKMKPRKVREGKRVRLRCGASGRPTLTFSWLKDGVALSPAASGITVKDKPSYSLLVFRSVTTAHAGMYQCSASNPLGRDEKEVRLEVIPARRAGHGRSPSRACTTQTFCLNGGQCVFHNETGAETCSCPSGFTGIRCQRTVQPVSPSIDTNQTPGNRNSVLHNSSISNNAHNQGRRKEHAVRHSSSQAIKPPNEDREKEAQSSGETTVRRPVTDSPDSGTLTIEDMEGNEGDGVEESGSDRKELSQTQINHLKSRLKSGRLKTSRCKEKYYCQNNGRCRYVYKVDVQFCECRKGFIGQRCETPVTGGGEDADKHRSNL